MHKPQTAPPIIPMGTCIILPKQSSTTQTHQPKMSTQTIVNIDIQGKLPKVASGKVRDLYAIDDDTLLFVASDRISAYDVIMENVSTRRSYFRRLRKSKAWY
jgi:hypothetical protein